MIFTFLIIAIFFYFIFGKNIKENLINLTSDHYGVKKNLNKCCENENCYDKPHYLNSSECNANIDVDYDFMVRHILILMKMHLALLKSEKQFLQLYF